MPSLIEWTDETWNPVTGCTKVSQGCKNCYAERIYERFHPGQKFTTVRTHTSRLQIPIHWKKPRMIFVNSMSDLFHESVDPDFIAQVFRIMEQTPHHTYQILTKRPAQMLAWFKAYNAEKPLPNVWLGVSVEDQKTANERIPLLIQVPAAVKFLSCEPLLGLINLAESIGESEDDDWYEVNLLQDANDDHEPEELIEECEAESDWINYGSDLVTNPEWKEWHSWRRWRAGMFKLGRKIDWLICGGESGPHARPMHPNWARELRDQCEVASIPFFFKQWGEFIYNEAPSNSVFSDNSPVPPTMNPVAYTRVGKKRAGHLLDGQEYRQFPQQVKPK